MDFHADRKAYVRKRRRLEVGWHLLLLALVLPMLCVGLYFALYLVGLWLPFQ